MDDRRFGPDQIGDRRAIDRASEAPFRPGGHAALWSRQMVSGRASAALGARALLAARRPADLAWRNPKRDAKGKEADSVRRLGPDPAAGGPARRRPGSRSP